MSLQSPAPCGSDAPLGNTAKSSSPPASLEALFAAYTSTHAHTLTLVLGDLQKARPSDWKDFVVKVMEAMEAHDCGLFPDEWFAGSSDD